MKYKIREIETVVSIYEVDAKSKEEAEHFILINAERRISSEITDRTFEFEETE